MKKEVFTFVFVLLVLMGSAQNNNSLDINCQEKKAFSAKTSFIQSVETENYNILYHRIFWQINPADHFIKGEVTSVFKALANNFTSISFDLSTSLEVDSVLYRGAKLAFEQSNNLLKATLLNILNIGDVDSITIFYQGVPESLTGFGSFETSTHNNTPVMWTLSEPYGAREWWPCKQSLTDKIDSIDIYIETPKEYRVGSNGKLIFEKTEGDKKLTFWKHRYPIATYLVAIAVTDYSSYSHYAKVSETDSVEILNFVYPENLESAKISTEFTVTVVELFSNLFTPYPFYKEKYGHAQFGWNGGMEHQTMSFMGGFSEHLITHELAHQWFGDHVTCGSWQHIWINEGFAVFCECLAQEHLYPETWNEWKQGRMNVVLNDAKSGSVFVEDTTDVSRIFNYALTYQKGGLILQVLRNQIGDEPFFTGINKMLTDSKTQGGFATAIDVQKLLEEAADTNLTTFFNDWYYGQGYPKYKINWEQRDDNVVNINMSQTTTHYSVPFFSMRVPVLLKGEDKEVLVTFHNTKNDQQFTYLADFPVTEIVFDPNYNIIAKHPAEINVGVLENSANTEITVMPNPAKESITVKAATGITFSNIIIIDVAGKTVYNKRYRKPLYKTNVKIAHFPAGTYYIQVTTNLGLVVKQFVKSI